MANADYVAIASMLASSGRIIWTDTYLTTSVNIGSTTPGVGNADPDSYTLYVVSNE